VLLALVAALEVVPVPDGLDVDPVAGGVEPVVDALSSVVPAVVGAACERASDASSS
jgi:hypothetical protein